MFTNSAAKLMRETPKKSQLDFHMTEPERKEWAVLQLQRKTKELGRFRIKLTLMSTMFDGSKKLLSVAPGAGSGWTKREKTQTRGDIKMSVRKPYYLLYLLTESAMNAARRRQAQLAKPPGSLGRLEEPFIQLAGITGNVHNQIKKKHLLVFAADNGVVSEACFQCSTICHAAANYKPDTR